MGAGQCPEKGVRPFHRRQKKKRERDREISEREGSPCMLREPIEEEEAEQEEEEEERERELPERKEKYAVVEFVSQCGTSFPCKTS